MRKKSKFKKAHDYSVRNPTLKEFFTLPALFKKAVHDDYKFYDKAVQQSIVKRYAIKHLIRAYLSERRVLLVAADQTNIMGVIVGILSPDGLGMVTWIYVHPKYRKEGIARSLLTKTEEIFTQKKCHKIMIATEIAPEFYRKMGYSKEGLLKKHWWGQDFYIFTKYLTLSQKNPMNNTL